MDGGRGHELHRRALSFRYAFSGCWYVLRTQRNAWIHAAATVMVFLLAVWLELPRSDKAILAITVAVVWMAEFANTAIEAVVDLAAPEYHTLARTAKDVAAGAVLIGAFAAVVVGLLLLGPPLWERLPI